MKRVGICVCLLFVVMAIGVGTASANWNDKWDQGYLFHWHYNYRVSQELESAAGGLPSAGHQTNMEINVWSHISGWAHVLVNFDSGTRHERIFLSPESPAYALVSGYMDNPKGRPAVDVYME